MPTGRTLMIHPPYVHDNYLAQGTPFVTDRQPFLPVAPLYAAELLELHGFAETRLFDCQLHDLRDASDVAGYDSYGISVMGAQNITPAYHVFRYLAERVDSGRIHVGGQGIEKLSEEEFQRVFPGGHKTDRQALAGLPGAMDVDLERQVAKLSDADLRVYLANEMTLPFSQGCLFGCSFCGAQIQRRESFFDVPTHLDLHCRLAKRFGVSSIDLYCTSLDFFQQALPGGDIARLTRLLEGVIELRERHGLDIGLRALTRADSYNAAMKSEQIRDLTAGAGFSRFGFGADGAASADVVRAMRKHADGLRSELLRAFEHMEANRFVPEILYVFGIPEDTRDTLAETRELCGLLLETFPNSEYRGFPAKNEIPGNSNWNRRGWQGSAAHTRLLDEPDLFLNLGFETLANEISHPDPDKRLMVNRFAVDMSHLAHELGRVGSYLTVPVADEGVEIMDDPTMSRYREIVANYAPDLAPGLRPDNLVAQRTELNSAIPKDT
ncbi:radical SAM protein [Streptomyces sp. SID3343]|uniref:radical SAM protein n=1 Tax=Streptomyces sp. SID3343 TaxID=2690260 RepID=UPI00136CCBB3|nr:radical SAM protein [Streptomyces sp. SID3343]MYW05901.1 hypothetical protein [Streptomyces sp. SID3343]